jgi:hypothetical protein
MELLEHGEGSLYGRVTQVELVDVLNESNAGIGEAEQTGLLEFGECLSLCRFGHAVEYPSHIFGSEGFGVIVIRLVWNGFTAPEFDLLGCKPDFEGIETNHIFALSGPQGAQMHR